MKFYFYISAKKSITEGSTTSIPSMMKKTPISSGENPFLTKVAMLEDIPDRVLRSMLLS